MKTLELGCGGIGKRDENKIYLDVYPHPGVDVVWDLNNFPWPLEDEEFDEVVAKHVFEHLDNLVKTMEEVHRILKKGGSLILYVPHFSHFQTFRDPTHRHFLTFESFDYFCKGLNKQHAKYTNIEFELVEKELLFPNHPFHLGKLISKLSMKNYERHFCHLFPAKTLYVKLRK